MLAPSNSPTPIRPIGVALPRMPQDICVGVPSCDPLVLHELLKAVRNRIPHAYTRAGQELGLTVARTQELIDKRVEIISAARAIKLARLIAYDPNARDVFGEAGQNIFNALHPQFPTIVRKSIRNLPKSLRMRLTLTWSRRLAHKFAGSVSRIYVVRRDHGIGLAVLGGVFSDRLDTLGCAHAYYLGFFETMFQQLALIDCNLAEIRRSRVHLNRCNFEIVWKA